ncbi:MAG TPA: acyl-CoA dehydrogenase family protein [Streptosporangiaceae bacterium]
MTKTVDRAVDGLFDDHLLEFDRHCREAAGGLREAGLRLDQDPAATGHLLGLPAVQLLQNTFLPPEYRGGSYLPAGNVASGAWCVEWAIVMERLSYGDPGVVLASPGASLSGGAVLTLGDDAQRDWFFGRLVEAPTWTFFGLTEPAKGSAVIELETKLTSAADGGWRLDGRKRYVGNGSRAQIGVAFCRRAPGPWGIEAVLVDTAEPGFGGEMLPSLGLRGAGISQLTFTGIQVPPERVLGYRRPPSRRGLYGALQTLMRARPTIATMALGVTQAVLDYVGEQRPAPSRHDQWRLDELIDRTAATRRLTYEVAADIDRGTINPHRIGGVKMRAARLAEQTTLLAAELLGPASLIEHPWLEKAHRDVRAFELMEGTSNIHRLSVFQGMLKNDFLPSATPGRANGSSHADRR